MIDLPIIDTHFHIWDLNKLEYPWLSDVPVINRDFLLKDYDEARGEQPITAMVFVQAECRPDQHLAELVWVQSLADKDERIKGIVPWAPLETGDAVEQELADIAKDSRVKGVRRIIQFESNPDFCVQPDFVRGVQLLAYHDLHFELTIAPSHFPKVMRLIEKCPDTRFLLDHIGNPNIADKQMEPWATYLKEFAASVSHPCKFSNFVCNADLESWTIDDLRPFADAVIETFGPDRLIWGSDWPHALRTSSYQRWLNAADQVTSGLGDNDRRKIFHDTAAAFYRIG